jgi:hypothetical protein
MLILLMLLIQAQRIIPEPDQYKAGGKVSMGRGMGKALRGGGKVMR